MSTRPFFLRGNGHAAPAVPAAADCATCRGRWKCQTPVSCHTAETHAPRRPLFWDTAAASLAIGWALAMGFLVALCAGLFR